MPVANSTAGDASSNFFFSSRRRHTRLQGDWSSDVCSSDLPRPPPPADAINLVCGVRRPQLKGTSFGGNAKRRGSEDAMDRSAAAALMVVLLDRKSVV